MDIDIQDANLFMMCAKLNANALSNPPPGYNIRRIDAGELDVWKRMHFDDEETATKYHDFMSRWFERVYAARKILFFERCFMACDGGNRPTGTCFFWEAYGAVPTIHWFKVVKECEGRGIGRALLSEVMKSIADYPVFLHTHPGSFRAIKLYSDFGFSLLLDPVINHG